jgi:hypothetical protein
MILAGFSFRAIAIMLGEPLKAIYTIPVACLVYCSCGALLYLCNKYFIHIKCWQFILLILFCSIIILLSVFILVGLINVPFVTLDLLTHKFWLFIFHTSDDPMGTLVMGLINIPLLLIFTSLSFVLLNFLMPIVSRK